MNEEIDNSTPEPSDSDIHDKLMAEAEAADRGEAETPTEPTPSAKQGVDGEGSKEAEDHAAASKADDKTTDNPESSAKTDEHGRKRGPDGKFLPKDEIPKVDEKPAEPEKPIEGEKPVEDSKYQKAKKDAERLDRSWKALDQEKQAVRQREQELRQLASDVQQLKQQRQQQPQGAHFDSRQYQLAEGEFRKRADKLMSEGDIDGAKEQLELADKARSAGAQASQQELQEAQQQFDNAWRVNAEAVIKEVPELGDPNSEAAQAMMELLEKRPILAHYSEGFRDAYEHLKGQKAIADNSGLREENSKLKAENERLNKLVSPHGPKGSPSHSATSRKFEDMALDEQRAILEREAELADVA